MVELARLLIQKNKLKKQIASQDNDSETTKQLTEKLSKLEKRIETLN
jgi:hypothetical protein